MNQDKESRWRSVRHNCLVKEGVVKEEPGHEPTAKKQMFWPPELPLDSIVTIESTRRSAWPEVTFLSEVKWKLKQISLPYKGKGTRLRPTSH